jgi:hypothetical protein
LLFLVIWGEVLSLIAGTFFCSGAPHHFARRTNLRHRLDCSQRRTKSFLPHKNILVTLNYWFIKVKYFYG